MSQENEEPEIEFPDLKIEDLEAMEKEVAQDEEVNVNYSQSKSPFITRYIFRIKISRKRNLEMPGIEPGAFHMQSERATTALHPLTI